jgi:hypothetical protein
MPDPARLRKGLSAVLVSKEFDCGCLCRATQGRSRYHSLLLPRPAFAFPRSFRGPRTAASGRIDPFAILWNVRNLREAVAPGSPSNYRNPRSHRRPFNRTSGLENLRDLVEWRPWALSGRLESTKEDSPIVELRTDFIWRPSLYGVQEARDAIAIMQRGAPFFFAVEGLQRDSLATPTVTLSPDFPLSSTMFTEINARIQRDVAAARDIL